MHRVIDLFLTIFGIPAIVVLVSGLPFVLAEGWDRLSQVDPRRPHVLLSQLMGGVVLVGLVLAMFTSGVGPAALILATLILVAFVRAWREEFAILLDRPDADFAGRHDKAILLLILIALAPVGLWLVRHHRRRRWPEAAATVDLGWEVGR